MGSHVDSGCEIGESHKKTHSLNIGPSSPSTSYLRSTPNYLPNRLTTPTASNPSLIPTNLSLILASHIKRAKERSGLPNLTQHEKYQCYLAHRLFGIYPEDRGDVLPIILKIASKAVRPTLDLPVGNQPLLPYDDTSAIDASKVIQVAILILDNADVGPSLKLRLQTLLASLT